MATKKQQLLKALQAQHRHNPVLEEFERRNRKCPDCSHTQGSKSNIASHEEWTCECWCHRSPPTTGGDPDA